MGINNYFTCIAAAGVPFVVQPHASLDPHLRKNHQLMKRLYLATIGRPLLARAAAVVFTAEQERDGASYHPRRPERIVPNGLDWSTYERLPRRGTFRTAYPVIDGPFPPVSRPPEPTKGPRPVLPAFERIARARGDLWLVLAGPDHEGYESHLRGLARRLGIEHRVLFTGMITDALRLAAYVDADLFVLPSYAENFGGVIIEALASGLPVLISDQVNIHRELSAAGAATVVECSIDSVAAGIASALADTGARARMATTGPALVRARYTWDAIAPMLIARYKDVIAREATPASQGRP